MTRALIGHTGFVGSTLLKQAHFDELFRSTNIGEIAGRSFDLIVCAGAPAQKWIANRDPAGDRACIERLIGQLASVHCDRFVLISTVDVFSHPIGVDEGTEVDETGLHAYGLHRRMLEKVVQKNFRNPLIVRLPGLVGPGLRKNVIFDLLNHNNLDAIDSRGAFQFYPMVNLWHDLQVALNHHLELLHLTAAPVSVQTVAEQGFGRSFDQPRGERPASYDMRTVHAGLFGGAGHYQYSARESLQAIRAYAQSETPASGVRP